MSNLRGQKQREDHARKEGQRKAKLWSQHAASFQIDETLEELFAKRTNKEKILQQLAEFCDGPLQSTQVIPFSSMWSDPKGQVVVAYFAARLDEPEVSASDIVLDINALLFDYYQRVSKKPLPLSAQYKGRTEDDLLTAQQQGVQIYHDGIPVCFNSGLSKIYCN